MTNEANTATCRVPATMEFLVIRSSGIRMALDMAQVDSIIRAEEAEQLGVPCSSINGLLGLNSDASSAGTPVLLYAGMDGLSGVAVDGLDAIISGPTSSIKPLPELLLRFSELQLFWGALLLDNEIVLLIDLHRITDMKSCNAEATA